MTDQELIARLRVDEPACEEHFTANLAADRIEELVKDNQQLKNALMLISVAWDQALRQRDAAEAKLAKAMDELDADIYKDSKKIGT